MRCGLGESVWVFHAGALGDHVMIWPLVRAMARQGARVTVVAAASHAAMCEREVGGSIGAGGGSVKGVSVEQPRFTRMWREDAAEIGHEEGVSAVVSFVADEESAGGRAWWLAARRMFPGAEMIAAGPPGSASRREVWERAEVVAFGGIEQTRTNDGSVVCFVGAGGESKRWGMERWVELARRLRASWRVDLLAGPVEAERMSEQDRALFNGAGGRSIGMEGGLAELADVIRAAALYVGCDTGPTHLAGQLGVPTIALFGPTDAGVWGPVGARVRVVAPSAPCSMAWLDVDRAMAEVELAAL